MQSLGFFPNEIGLIYNEHNFNCNVSIIQLWIRLALPNFPPNRAFIFLKLLCRIARKKRDKEEQVAYKLEQEIALWDPTANTESTQDQFKTLFVSRINFDTSESKLRREFDSYGPIKSIRMVHDQKTGKPRGYAFIEYEHEKDMHSKYKPIKDFDLKFSSGDQLDWTFTVILFYLRISWLHSLWALAIFGRYFLHFINWSNKVRLTALLAPVNFFQNDLADMRLIIELPFQP